MAKILGETHSPYVPDVDTHSLTLKREPCVALDDSQSKFVFALTLLILNS